MGVPVLKQILCIREGEIRDWWPQRYEERGLSEFKSRPPFDQIGVPTDGGGRKRSFACCGKPLAGIHASLRQRDLIRELRVVGFSPSRAAAPFTP